MEVATHKDAVVFGFGKNLAVPFGAECDAHAGVESKLVYGVGSENIFNRYRDGIKSEKRIETRHYCDVRLCEFLVAMEKAHAAGHVYIHVAARIQMNDRIQRRRKDIQAAVW